MQKETFNQQKVSLGGDIAAYKQLCMQQATHQLFSTPPLGAIKPEAREDGMAPPVIVASACAYAAVLGVGVGVGLGLGAMGPGPERSSQPAGPERSPRPVPPPPSSRVIVVMSGGAAISPFTTPTAACKPLPNCSATASCWTAGNTDSFIRDYFLARGYDVYTAPSTVGVGVASQDLGYGGFFDCEAPLLPSYMTVNNIGDIDFAGSSLASFLLHLRDAYGVRVIDIVAHSMGGLYTRSALRSLRDRGWPVRVRSLTTIGTPWEGVWQADLLWSKLGFSGLASSADCQGDPVCLSSAAAFEDEVTQRFALPGAELTSAYIQFWNSIPANVGVLDDITVNIFGGGYFVAPDPGNASTRVWPNDGLPSLASALAWDVPEATLPRANVRINATFASNLHSAFFTNAFDRPIGDGARRGGRGGRLQLWSTSAPGLCNRLIACPPTPSSADVQQ